MTATIVPVEEQHPDDLVLGDQRHGQHRAQLQQLDDLEADALVVTGVADRHRSSGAGRQRDVRQVKIREPDAEHLGVVAVGVAGHPGAVLTHRNRGGLGLQGLSALDDGAAQDLLDLAGSS